MSSSGEADRSSPSWMKVTSSNGEELPDTGPISHSHMKSHCAVVQTPPSSEADEGCPSQMMRTPWVGTNRGIDLGGLEQHCHNHNVIIYWLVDMSS
mmetsp:Transcript_18714/g.39209  ORF Transcript_18714/g.39209 Transcript_18714/m.39209 type:complete len:96 (-) Transcript_18714:88-375(-)